MGKYKIFLVINLKTGDKEWISGFYPVKRIREECNKAKIDFQFILEKEFVSWFNGVYIKHQENRGNTCNCFWLRGVKNPLVFDLLESNHCCYFNSLKSNILAGDKLKLWEKFKESPVKLPAIFTPAEAKTNLPVIIKPRTGKMGEGVELIETKAGLDKFINKIKKGDVQKKDFIFQECITESLGRDIRILFCNHKITATIKRCNRNSIFSNGCKGGKAETYRPGKQLKKTAEYIIRETGLFCGSIDFLYGKKDFYLCELNSAPGFEYSEKDTDKNLISPWIKEIKRFMEKSEGSH